MKYHGQLNRELNPPSKVGPSQSNLPRYARQLRLVFVFYIISKNVLLFTLLI